MKEFNLKDKVYIISSYGYHAVVVLKGVIIEKCLKYRHPDDKSVIEIAPKGQLTTYRVGFYDEEEEFIAAEINPRSIFLTFEDAIAYIKELSLDRNPDLLD